MDSAQYYYLTNLKHARVQLLWQWNRARALLFLSDKMQLRGFLQKSVTICQQDYPPFAGVYSLFSLAAHVSTTIYRAPAIALHATAKRMADKTKRMRSRRQYDVRSGAGSRVNDRHSCGIEIWKCKQRRCARLGEWQQHSPPWPARPSLALAADTPRDTATTTRARVGNYAKLGCEERS